MTTSESRLLGLVADAFDMMGSSQCARFLREAARSAGGGAQECDHVWVGSPHQLTQVCARCHIDKPAAAPTRPTRGEEAGLWGEYSELEALLIREMKWSRETFGEGLRTKGVTQHIEKECAEIRANPTDLVEWIDVSMLAFDGYWRAGGDPCKFLTVWRGKLEKNMARKWRQPISQDDAVEHIKAAPTHPGAEPAAAIPTAVEACANRWHSALTTREPRCPQCLSNRRVPETAAGLTDISETAAARGPTGDGAEFPQQAIRVAPGKRSSDESPSDGPSPVPTSQDAAHVPPMRMLTERCAPNGHEFEGANTEDGPKAFCIHCHMDAIDLPPEALNARGVYVGKGQPLTPSPSQEGRAGELREEVQTACNQLLASVGNTTIDLAGLKQDVRAVVQQILWPAITREKPSGEAGGGHISLWQHFSNGNRVLHHGLYLPDGHYVAGRRVGTEMALRSIQSVLFPYLNEMPDEDVCREVFREIDKIVSVALTRRHSIGGTK